MTRTFQYLFPIINAYPLSVYDKLKKAKIVDVYLGYLDQVDDFFVVTKDRVETDKYITESYYRISSKNYVSKVPILEAYRYMVPLFWKGKYDQLYKKPLHHYNIPKTYGNRLNMVYHVLMNTELGKSLFKETMVKHQYLDPQKNVGEFTFEEFIPEQADYPPSKKQEVLT